MGGRLRSSAVSPSAAGLPALPTAELHVHIEGTLEPELAFELARRNGVQLRHPDLAALRRAYSFQDLQSFLDLYYELTAVPQPPQDLTDPAQAEPAPAAAPGGRPAEGLVGPPAHP